MARKGFTEFLLVSGPKILGGAGTIGLNLLLIRFLSPELFGLFTLCVSAILLSDGILGSAFDQSVLRLAPLYRSSDPARSYQIERGAVLLKLGLGIVLCLALMALAPTINRLFLHHDAAPRMIVVSALAVVTVLLFRSTLLHFQIERRFKAYGALDLVQQVIKFGAIGLVLWLMTPVRPEALLACLLAGPSLVFLICLPQMWRTMLAPKSVGERAPSGEVMRELVSFGRWFLLTFALTAIVGRLDIIMLTVLTDLKEVGIFSGAFVFAMIPELLGTYVAVVLAPRIMPLYHAGRFEGFYKKFQLYFGAFALVGLVAGAAGLGVLKALFFSEQFAPSARILLILLPGALMTMACFPMSYSFAMFIRPRFLLKLELVILPLTLLGFGLLIPHYGAVGAAWVTTLSRLLKGVIVQAVTWHWSAGGMDPAAPEDATPNIDAEGDPRDVDEIETSMPLMNEQANIQTTGA